MRRRADLSIFLAMLTLLGCGRVDMNDGSGGATATGGAPGTGGTSPSGGSPDSTGGSACDDANGGNLFACREERIQTCGETPLESCKDLPYCEALRAWPIDESLDCVEGSFDVVGCGIIGCGASFTRSRDPAGNEWRFPSTCQPY